MGPNDDRALRERDLDGFLRARGGGEAVVRELVGRYFAAINDGDVESFARAVHYPDVARRLKRGDPVALQWSQMRPLVPLALVEIERVATFRWSDTPEPHYGAHATLMVTTSGRRASAGATLWILSEERRVVLAPAVFVSCGRTEGCAVCRPDA